MDVVLIILSILTIGGFLTGIVLSIYAIVHAFKPTITNSSQRNFERLFVDNKFRIKALIVVIILILSIGFYWFQYLASEAKKTCNNIALVNKNSQNTYSFIYKACIRSKGY